MRLANLLLPLLLITALLSDGFAHAQSQAKPQPKPTRGIAGQQAPDWSVSKWHQLPDGKKTLNVSDYKGKVLYLYFFQSWCPGCHSTGFPNLKTLHTKFKDDPNVEFAVIQTTFEGHAVNTAKKLAPTARKFKLPIPFGQSKERTGTPDIMRKYRTGGTPWVVIIDKEGTVQFNGFHVDPEKVVPFIEQLKQR